MAKLFLGTGAGFTVQDNVDVIGSSGQETLKISGTPTVTVNSVIERVELTGNLADYKYQVAGNQVYVYTGATKFATIGVQDDADGTKMAFADGSADMKITGMNLVTIGGKSVSTIAGGAAITDAPLNTSDKSAVTSGSTSSDPTSKLFLGANESFTVRNNVDAIGSSGQETLKISGTPTVTVNSVIERVELTGNLADYKYQVAGNQVYVYTGATKFATIGVQDDADGTKMAFADGSADMKITGMNLVTIGGKSVSTIAGGAAITGATLNTSDKSTVAAAVPATLASQASAVSTTKTGIDTLLTTSNTAVLGLNSDSKWNATALTYSFPASLPADYASYPECTNNWSALNAAETAAVKAVFGKLAEIVPLTFSETAGTGDFRFSVVNQTSAGFAYYPTNTAGVGGDVFLATSNRTGGTQYGYVAGDAGFATVVHEIGHAMGLKHSFESPTVPAGTDNSGYTIMSYTHARNDVLTFTKTAGGASYTKQGLAMPDNYVLYDIATLQAVYGANTATRTGSNTYSLSSKSYDYLCIWDGGGTDTIDVSTVTGTCTVDMKPGTRSTIDLWTIADQQAATIASLSAQGFNNDAWVASAYSTYSSDLYTGENNLSIAYGVIIENVSTGSGNDSVMDNLVNNYISTGAGNDTITLGAGGYDTVDGGTGTDQVKLSVNRSQVQQETQSDGSLLLVVSGQFAVKLIGVESVLCADGLLT